MKFKTTLRCHLRPGRRAVPTKTRDSECWWACRGALCTAGGSADWSSLYGKQCRVSKLLYVEPNQKRWNSFFVSKGIIVFLNRARRNVCLASQFWSRHTYLPEKEVIHPTPAHSSAYCQPKELEWIKVHSSHHFTSTRFQGSLLQEVQALGKREISTFDHSCFF